jgi:uncharacterized protein DUF3604
MEDRCGLITELPGSKHQAQPKGTTMTYPPFIRLRQSPRTLLVLALAGCACAPSTAALGAEVMASSGQPVKLSTPLDWLVVSDHSDGMGVIAEIRAKNPEAIADPVTARWGEMMAKGGADAQAATVELVAAHSQGKLPKAFLDPKFMKSTWEKNTAIMEKYNEPGRFTALQ